VRRDGTLRENSLFSRAARNVDGRTSCCGGARASGEKNEPTKTPHCSSEKISESWVGVRSGEDTRGKA